MNHRITYPILIASGALVLGAFGCSGELRSELTQRPAGETNGQGGVEPTGPTGPTEPVSDHSFACDEAAVAPEVPMRRLSMDQYRHTVHDLARALSTRQDLWERAEDLVERMPEDTPTGASNDTHGGYPVSYTHLTLPTIYSV